MRCCCSLIKKKKSSCTVYQDLKMSKIWWSHLCCMIQKLFKMFLMLWSPVFLLLCSYLSLYHQVLSILCLFLHCFFLEIVLSLVSIWKWSFSNRIWKIRLRILNKGLFTTDHVLFFFTSADHNAGLSIRTAGLHW